MNKDLEIMNHTMQNWMKDSEKYSDELFHFQAEGKEWSLQQVLLHNVSNSRSCGRSFEEKFE
jgi:hypothetical protein